MVVVYHTPVEEETKKGNTMKKNQGLVTRFSIVKKKKSYGDGDLSKDDNGGDEKELSPKENPQGVISFSCIN